MPQKTKAVQTSPVEEITFATLTQRADETLAELDEQELTLNRHIASAKQELSAIVDARETRATHLEELRHEAEDLQSKLSEAVSYARLTGASGVAVAVTVDLQSKLSEAQEQLAQAQIEHDQAESAAKVREDTLQQALPSLQSQSRAIRRECGAVETALARAQHECGQRRTAEAKQAIVEHREGVKAAQGVLKAKQKGLTACLASIEEEFVSCGWSNFWDELTEFIEAEDLKEELEAEDEDDE